MSNIPLTQSEINEMLNSLCIENVNDLFNIIPKKFKFNIDQSIINESLSEYQLTQNFQKISNNNLSASNSLFFMVIRDFLKVPHDLIYDNSRYRLSQFMAVLGHLQVIIHRARRRAAEPEIARQRQEHTEDGRQRKQQQENRLAHQFHKSVVGDDWDLPHLFR